MRIKRNVFLVESDVAQCNMLSDLLASSRYKVKPFSSAESFLENAEGMPDGIMLLDQSLTGMSGLELQDNLARRGTDMPIVFISERRDVRSAVKAIKAGATDFLEKPFSNEELLSSLKEAFSQADKNKSNSIWIASVRQCYDKLTDREREIMQHVVTGMSSKEVGEMLGISYRTVEVHRLNIMRKMETKSLPDLIRKYGICQNNSVYRLRGDGAKTKH